MSNKLSDPGSEDTVQCFIYSFTHNSNVGYWKNKCEEVNNLIKTLSKDYIWQRDEFQVIIPLSTHELGDLDSPTKLYSCTCFGDNIEDEWFIVHLLLEISKSFPELIIQVTDNDGDFLLIEAADYLPNWANPETTANRVFIYNNHIHIIPPEVVNLETKLELKATFKILNDLPELTRASTEVEQAILNRIGKYPAKLSDSIHRTPVTLPSQLAALLILKPSLIAPLVNAYCNHDIIDAKSCRNTDFSDCVTIEVKFTKFLYATLMHSKLINCVRHSAHGNDKKNILGLKLICGFQMIMNKASTNLFDSKDYHQFIDNLKKNGYFKNNIEGSKDYIHLLNNANEYYNMIECPVSSHLSHTISQLMLSSDYSNITKSIKDQYSAKLDWKGDNEEWLNVHPDQLNELLMSRYGKTTKLKSNDVISSQTVTRELSSFLKQTSGFEGIEANGHDNSAEENIEFESDKFVSCIEKMLSILSTGEEKIEPESDDYDLTDDEDFYNTELETKLQKDDSGNTQNNETIFENIIQSMKEEKSSAGPTTNLLRSIGIQRSDILDSDDELD